MTLDPAARLRLVLRLTPERWRCDAEQEAALARLEGRDPAAAVDRFRKRMMAFERREIPATEWLTAMRHKDVWRERGPDHRADPRDGARTGRDDA